VDSIYDARKSHEQALMMDLLSRARKR